MRRAGTTTFVERVRRLRAEGDPRLVLALYVLVSAALIAWTGLVPGYPSYGPGSRLAASAIAISAVLVLLMARRSPVAWWAAIALNGVGLLISLAGSSPKFAVCAVLYATSLLLLRSRSLESHVRRLPRAPAAPATG